MSVIPDPANDEVDDDSAIEVEDVDEADDVDDADDVEALENDDDEDSEGVSDERQPLSFDDPQ